jgi:DNA-binding transcriptional LysR family regulator
VRHRLPFELQNSTEAVQDALPPGHPLTHKRTLGASELHGARLIVMNEGHCLGDQVLNFCDRHDLRHHVSFGSAQLETIQSLVRAGLGISLIPAMAARRDSTNAPEYRSLRSPNQSVSSSPSGPLNVRSVEQPASLLRQSRHALSRMWLGLLLELKMENSASTQQAAK